MATIIHNPTEAPEGGWREGDQLAVLLDDGTLQSMLARKRHDAVREWVTPDGYLTLGVAERWLREGQILVAVLVDRPKLPTTPGSVIRFEATGALTQTLRTLVRDDSYGPSHPWRDHRGNWWPEDQITAWTLILDAGAEQ